MICKCLTDLPFVVAAADDALVVVVVCRHVSCGLYH